MKLQNVSLNNSDGNRYCQNDECGVGGFLPFGFTGVVKGAATCFYAFIGRFCSLLMVDFEGKICFIGFDCIATTGEEVDRPHRTIPLSIIFTLITVAICYISVSIIVTLMIPYFLLNPDSPFESAFDYVNYGNLKYAITVGAIISIITCLYASMFPMPRVVYAMASEGLIFKFMGYVHPHLKTPINACIFTGVFSAIMSCIFNLEELISMLSIGTLLAYTLVSACCITLRLVNH